MSGEVKMALLLLGVALLILGGAFIYAWTQYGH